MAESFSRGKSNEVEDMERERDQPYRKIGQLQVEVDWLKKSQDRGNERIRETIMH